MSSKPYFEQVATQWDAMREEFFSTGVRRKAYAAARLRWLFPLQERAALKRLHDQLRQAGLP